MTTQVRNATKEEMQALFAAPWELSEDAEWGCMAEALVVDRACNVGEVCVYDDGSADYYSSTSERTRKLYQCAASCAKTLLALSESGTPTT